MKNKGPERIRIVSIRQVYNDGNHNAFTDLCRFQGHYYLTFRSCPDGHMIYDSSQIVVLQSDDLDHWHCVCRFGVPGRDVRDPHFVLWGAKLFVYTGTWLVGAEAPARGDPNDMLGYAAWSHHGEHWEGPRPLEGTRGHYIWRGSVYQGWAYLCGRRYRGLTPPIDPAQREAHIEAALLRSKDGFSWESVGLFRESYGNETAFVFEEDGAILAIHRGRGTLPAEVCRAKPPYERFERTPLDRNIGGPLLARWGDRYLVAGRNTVNPENPFTALYWLVDNRLVEAAELPSGGDNSYPGFVPLDEQRGLLSYYSSHEGSGTSLAPSAIYLAELAVE